MKIQKTPNYGQKVHSVYSPHLFEIYVYPFNCKVKNVVTQQVNGDFGPTTYPAVPGHEVAGVVTSVGAEVKDLEVKQ